MLFESQQDLSSSSDSPILFMTSMSQSLMQARFYSNISIVFWCCFILFYDYRKYFPEMVEIHKETKRIILG